MTEKRGMKALELWCRRVTEGYPGVKIENMTTSWRDGLAFCALIHHFRPDLIDFDRLDKRDIYKNNELAFRTAERQLGIPALLDAEDMVEYEVPDRLSILTYLSQFYQTFVSNPQGSPTPTSRTHSAKVTEIISPTSKTPKVTKVGSNRLETCWTCKRPVFLAERLVAGGKLRHRTCFTCKRCGEQLNLVGCYETENGDFVCETCPDEENSKIIQDDFSKPPKEEQSVPVKDYGNEDATILRDSILLKRRSDMKSTFLNNLVDVPQDSDENPVKSAAVTSDANVPVPNTSLSGPETEEDLNASLPSHGILQKQHSTASLESLNFKIKTLLGKDSSETLSLLNHESESFVADISDIIDNIISDAVKKAENHMEGIMDVEADKSQNVDISSETPMDSMPSTGEHNVIAEGHEESNGWIIQNYVEAEVKEEETSKTDPEKSDDYPDELNPFAEDPDESHITHPARKPPTPATRRKAPRPAVYNESGRKIIEAPVVNLNPFWSDGEPSSEEDVPKPVPAPRTSLRGSEEDSPFSRSQYGSFTSLSSLASSASAYRRKKGPAPLPPTNVKNLQSNASSSPSSASLSPAYRSPSPLTRSYRKSKPAPPPPPSVVSCESEIALDKKEKNYENKIKQNLSVPDKSAYGKWKRKKGQAPALPIPQRRRITPLPLSDFYRELEDLEIQQRELERQGVTIEQTIRMYETDNEKSLGGSDLSEIEEKDVEGLILQLFDIVNQKNELFRRQAELMYLRRQQRLEEEHADIEYQIRCLMGRPERNKTDSDKAQEEELIKRLVDIVERRNEIIECLDMDRKREVEEDKSIQHHLDAFAGKKMSVEESPKDPVKVSPSFLKLLKKKKKKKLKESFSSKSRHDVDKDIDEASKEDDLTKLKTKKKWFVKP